MDFINMQYAWILNALKREEGQTFAEYALIFALVVVGAIVALTGIGTQVAVRFAAVATALAG